MVAQGKVRPENLMPNVGPYELYLSAFNELSSCRPGGMGISPMPFTAIVEYARIYEIEDFHEFLDVIRSMDSEFLAQEEKKQQAATSKKNGKHSSKGN